MPETDKLGIAPPRPALSTATTSALTMTDDASLTIRPLPPRPTEVSDDALRDVFGGCDEEGEYCVKHSDCCGDMLCSGHSECLRTA